METVGFTSMADGTPQDVLTPERLRAVYGVDPRFVTVAAATPG